MEALYKLFKSSTGVETDTRKIKHGSLFFCLKGANFDGNRFAEEALKLGAIAAVVDNPEYHMEGKTLLVDDVLLALQNLARHHRNQFKIPVLGITGSNGKTTSKELISTVLATQYRVHFTQGNFNNHIGVPLTLLQLNETHEIAVIEMGANKPGDIKELVEIALPTHGIITNIGRAHLEGFKSLEGVIKTKTELFDFLAQEKGHVFANKQDETIINKLPASTHNHFYNDESELGGSLLRLTPLVEMEWFEPNYTSPTIQTNLVGEYNFINFLAAIRIGRFFEISPENCNQAISAYEPTNNRSQVTKTDKNTLIVDCYNANPTSMRSALFSFAKIETHAKIFILGDMREMGDDAPMVHEEVIQQTIDLRLSGFFIGEEFLKFKGMHPNAIFLKSTDPLIEHFTNNPPADLLILLKGSRGISLEKVIPYL
ncbi:MAG: UDP-N-acetylmuramoyl-tripeptide--D-alanyl-D-alanine ligase [Fluviicola sp.]